MTSFWHIMMTLVSRHVSASDVLTHHILLCRKSWYKIIKWHTVTNSNRTYILIQTRSIDVTLVINRHPRHLANHPRLTGNAPFSHPRRNLLSPSSYGLMKFINFSFIGASWLSCRAHKNPNVCNLTGASFTRRKYTRKIRQSKQTCSVR